MHASLNGVENSRRLPRFDGFYPSGFFFMTDNNQTIMR